MKRFDMSRERKIWDLKWRKSEKNIEKMKI